MRGFTLLEIIIALGFLAVLILPIASLLTIRDKDTFYQNSQISALQGASSIMEELSQKAFEDPNGLPQVALADFGLDIGELLEDRNTWDDIDDYHHQLITINNNTVVSVDVAYVPDAVSVDYRELGVTDNQTSFKRVMVSSKVANSSPVEFIKIFANYYNP